MESKELEGLNFDYSSVNPNDFVEILNQISPQIGGVTNLGVFADIIKVTPGYAIKCISTEEFINVNVLHGESPEMKLINDGSSSEPYDFDFSYLLNKEHIVKGNE
ncbi:MAG: hypothetical protein LKF31_04680 [Muribaculaceae bacterium]|jgi:hypothetical protein|nr:hypothetical protein [Muribaculaceae bacterium]